MYTALTKSQKFCEISKTFRLVLEVVVSTNDVNLLPWENFEPVLEKNGIQTGGQWSRHLANGKNCNDYNTFGLPVLPSNGVLPIEGSS